MEEKTNIMVQNTAKEDSQNLTCIEHPEEQKEFWKFRI